MKRSWVVVLGGAAAVCAGCGPGATPISPACTESQDVLMAALRTAPAPVTLPDGFRLSRCVSDGLDDAELQNVGTTFHQAAEALRVRARSGSDAAAVQLGYLIGATRRGARHTGGVMAELQRRVELVGGRLEDEAPARAAAVERGLAAGESGG